MHDSIRSNLAEEVRAFTVLSTISMLWEGWECDSESWIIQVQATDARHLVMTSHGRVYIASEKELQDQIETNLAIVEEQQAALALLNA